MTDRNVVLLSTADWDNPFWTNKQHVAVEFCRRGYKVLYIDSLGLRRPSVSSRDIRRVIRRIVKAIRSPRKVADNVWVWSPIMLPFNGVRLVRRLNRAFLALGLAFWRRKLGIGTEMLWTYNPMSAELLRLSQWSKVVYHCVDEIKAQPGMPAVTLERAELGLVSKADLVFVTSTTLERSRRLINKNTHYLPNVADFEHFSRALDDSTTVPPDLANLPGPKIGFIGAISAYKIDFALLREVAIRNPEWSIVLIGEVGEGDPWTNSESLKGISNLHLLGPRAYSTLPSYLKGIDVAILPNVLNEYTAAMFPMKFFEYLASGRPVVSTMLPSLMAYRNEARLTESPDDFIEGIRDALAGDCSSLERRLDLAKQHTYSSRMERMLGLVAEVAK